MKTGKDILALAAKHIGEKYVLGALVPKNDANYKGPFDCAEFISYVIYQLTGKLYGCERNTGSPARADAYTGFWGRDAKKLCKTIPVAEALATPGAILLRLGSKSAIGHIVFSTGAGGTIEAHSTKIGVIRSSAQNRRWDIGILVPDFDYATSLVPYLAPDKLYRLKTPLMKGEPVKAIQKALGMVEDGVYGAQTEQAVRIFQARHALIADGEVGPQTAKAMGVTL